MKLTNIFRAIPALILVALNTVCLAHTVLDTTTVITQSDPVQVGRTSRNGLQQDWVGTESFGGTINTDFLFHYHTYTIPAATLSQGRFVQVFLDDLGLNQAQLFVSAYANSYDPTSQGTNWLGDAGTSGNFLNGTSPVFFQVAVPPATDLVLVVWNTGLDGPGIGEKFRLIAEQFTDVAYSDPVVPTINISASAPQVKRGDQAVLTFTASAAPTQMTTVTYSTSGSAQLGQDYTLSGPPGQVVFSPGQTSATVTLNALQGSKSKSSKGNHSKRDEVVTVAIGSGESYLIGGNNTASIVLEAASR
jgi:hypothetical protein